MSQSVTECYRVFLAHLLGPIFWLVYRYYACQLDRFYGFHDLSYRYKLIGGINPETNEQIVTEEQKMFEKVNDI